jgi:cytochrome c
MSQASRAKIIVILTLLLMAMTSPAHAQLTPSDRGGSLYMQKCISCHGLDKNKSGPMLRGVFENKAGQVKGFAYSAALLKSGITWDAITLGKFLANPANVIKGTTMVGSVEAQKDRDDLVEFLKNIPKTPAPQTPTSKSKAATQKKSSTP